MTYDQAFNYGEAIEKLEGINVYKLIISDWDDEFVDGYDLLVFVKKSPKYKDITYIIISEKRDNESMLKCLHASASAYIPKPIYDLVIDQKIKPFLVKIAPENQDNIKSLNIPPCPAIIIKLYAELKKEAPNLNDIVEHIKKDVVITASLIRLSNAPIYGAGQVDSVERALNILGLDNFKNMVLASSLQNSVKSIGIASDVFQRHSVAVATVCSYLAKKKNPSLVDAAYLTGLFHDCAIPLFLKRSPDYEKIFDQALSGLPDITKTEEEILNTNHADIGALVVGTWKIEEKIIVAMRYHHSNDILIPISETYYQSARELWAFLILSEHICHHHGYAGASPVISDDEFLEIYHNVKMVLLVNAHEVAALKEEAFPLIENISDSL